MTILDVLAPTLIGMLTCGVIAALFADWRDKR